MDEFLQYIGSFGRLLLKIAVVIIILRMITQAAGLPIVEYLPIIDEVISLIFELLKFLASLLNKIVSSVIHF